MQFGSTIDGSKATSFGYVYFSPYADNSNSSAITNPPHFSAYVAYSAILDITDEWYGIGQLDGTSELKAIWSPTYVLTLDKGINATGGDDKIWLKYNVGYYRDSTLATPLDTTHGMNVPSNSGYTLKGYYTGTNGTGKKIVGYNSNKQFVLESGVKNTDFSNNATLYAYWEKNAPSPTPTPTPTTYYNCQFLYDVCSINVSHSGVALGWSNNVKNGWCQDTFLNGVFYCTKGTILGKSVAATSGASTCNSLSNSSGTIGWSYTAELSASGSWGNCKCSTGEQTFTTGYIATYTTKPTTCPDYYLSKLGSSCRPSCQ